MALPDYKTSLDSPREDYECPEQPLHHIQFLHLKIARVGYQWMIAHTMRCRAETKEY